MKFGQYSLVAQPIRVQRSSTDSSQPLGTLSRGASTSSSASTSTSSESTGACGVSRHGVATRDGLRRQWTKGDLSRLGEDILGMSRDYIMYKVAIACHDGVVPDPVNRYATVMRKVANAMERRHATEFDGMFSQLNMDRTTAYEMFEFVVRGLFDSGINWGRFVALFCFSGLVAVRCAIDADMAELVPSVITWLARFVSRDLSDWICDHGGLDGFCGHFSVTIDGDGASVDVSGVFRAVAEGLLFTIGLATAGVLLGWLFQNRNG